MAALKPILSAIWHVIEPFTPGVLGAAVAQMLRPGLGIRTRFIQWTVSVIVFHFVSLALTSVFGWADAIADVIGFFIAFLAFEALHAWKQAAVEAGVDLIKGLPVVIQNIAASWGRRPGSAETPKTPEGDG